MAIEDMKKLNVRVSLKYDTYKNWYDNNPVLLAGEAAIATVQTTINNNPATGDNGLPLNPPTVLIKIGDGTTHYRDLSFVSAKAADVLEACKSENGLTTFINNILKNANFADNAAITGLTGRMDDVEDAIEVLNGNDTTAGSVAKAIKDAITALDLANAATYAAKNHNHEISDVNGLQDALDGKQAKGDYAAEVHTHVKADITDFAHTHTKSEITDFAHTHTASEVTDLDATIKSYGYATKDEAKGYADAKNDAIAEAKKAGTDASDALDTYKGEMTTALAGKQDVIPENTYDAYGSAATAEQNAKSYADQIKSDLLGTEELEGTYDTLKEIGKWIETSGVDATELTDAIAVETQAREAGDKAINDTLATYGDIVTHDAADFAEAGHDHDDAYSKLGHKHIVADITDYETDVAAKIKVETDARAEAVEDLQGQIDAVKATADGAVQEIATGSANGTIAVDGTDVAVKGLGTAAFTDDTAFDAAGAADTVKHELLGDTDATVGPNTILGVKEVVGNVSGRVDVIRTAIGTQEGSDALYDVQQGDADTLAAAKNYADGLADNYATSGHTHKIDELTQDENTYVIFNCGTSSVNI